MLLPLSIDSVSASSAYQSLNSPIIFEIMRTRRALLHPASKPDWFLQSLPSLPRLCLLWHVAFHAQQAMQVVSCATEGSRSTYAS